MILDSSYTNLNCKQFINYIVGKPFSFLTTIRLGSVDSKLIMVEEVSDYLKFLLQNIIEGAFVSMELRPHGLIISFFRNREIFIWIITYYQLALNTSVGIRIQEGNHYIIFRDQNTLKHNQSFFEKLAFLKMKEKKKVSVLQRKKFNYKL